MLRLGARVIRFHRLQFHFAAEQVALIYTCNAQSFYLISRGDNSFGFRLPIPFTRVRRVWRVVGLRAMPVEYDVLYELPRTTGAQIL